MGRRVRIIIATTLPPRATYKEVREFVKDALESWGGQRHPDDPLFGSMRIGKVKIDDIAPPQNTEPGHE